LLNIGTQSFLIFNEKGIMSSVFSSKMIQKKYKGVVIFGKGLKSESVVFSFSREE